MAKRTAAQHEGATDQQKPKRTRGPRQPKPDAFSSDDYRDFHVMNEQMLKAEKAKGENSDDELLARLLARRSRLQKLSAPTQAGAQESETT